MESTNGIAGPVLEDLGQCAEMPPHIRACFDAYVRWVYTDAVRAEGELVCDRGGKVPSPAVTDFAAEVSAANGKRIYVTLRTVVGLVEPDVDAMAAIVFPAPDEVAARAAEMFAKGEIQFSGESSDDAAAPAGVVMH